MSSHGVAEAKSHLSELIDRALKWNPPVHSSAAST
jgi:hypothetical protein